MTMPDEIATLLDRADGLEYGPTRTSLCEEAVRLADTRNDLEAGFRARLKLTEAACFGGQPDLELVSFSWVLAQLDNHPDRFGWHTWDVLWQYKWVVSEAPSFPHIGRDRILELVDDMGRRFRAWGSTMHAVHHKRRGVFEEMGDRRRALAAHTQMEKRPRDTLSDCEACCLSWSVHFLSFLGDYEAAAAAAKPIIAKRMSCASVPQNTYAAALFPLFKAGNLKTAMQYHRAGYRMVANRTGHLSDVADHVEFLVLTDNTARAAQIAERHLGMVAGYPTPSLRREWYRVLRLLFARLAEKGKKEVRFRLPADHPLKVADLLPPGTLFDWYDREARALAAAFDRRNGNAFYTAAIDGQVDLLREITPFPYS